MTDLSHTDRLCVEIGPLKISSPLIGASGTCGFGSELNQLGVLKFLGVLVTKTITPEPREGNPPPRTWETRAGVINSIGLANPGLKAFVKEIAPSFRELPCPVFASIGAEDLHGYLMCAEELKETETVSGLELNLSCPNVTGGLDMSRSQEALYEVTQRVREVWEKPLWVKVTPVAPSIPELVKAASKAGADAVVVANTYPAMAIDWRKRRSRLGSPTGGLSGPAVKPLTLRLVHQAFSVGLLPVVASGGVAEPEDVLEFIVAGASAVQLGSIILRDPHSPRRFFHELAELLEAESIKNLRELVGTLKFQGISQQAH